MPTLPSNGATGTTGAWTAVRFTAIIETQPAGISQNILECFGWIFELAERRGQARIRKAADTAQ